MTLSLHDDRFVAPHAPLLLDYHPGIDPDANYIPKTTCCFAAGGFAMGICLNMLAVVLRGALDNNEAVYALMLRMAFVFGITGVGSSLLLVGLKVREDHVNHPLYARHWLNALGTGALFSLLVWGPWLIAEQGIAFNRFLAAGVWMLLMALPGVAALWVVGPRRLPYQP